MTHLSYPFFCGKIDTQKGHYNYFRRDELKGLSSLLMMMMCANEPRGNYTFSYCLSLIPIFSHENVNAEKGYHSCVQKKYGHTNIFYANSLLENAYYVHT